MNSERANLNQRINQMQADSTFTERMSDAIVGRVKRNRAIKRSACAVAVFAFAFSGYLVSGNHSDSVQWNTVLGVSRAELATQTQTQMRWAETDDVISSALVNR